MKLAFLQHVYEQPGPFATVYLDTSADAEDARKTIELRWRSAREQLTAQGADADTVRAIEEAISEHEWRVGRRGQVMVASHGRVLLQDELPQPPTQFSDDEGGWFGPLPVLLPYLRARGARIPYVVAVVDHEGADVTAVNATREAGTSSVEGGHMPIHKSYSAGEGNLQRHQHAVEEQWHRNAERAADEVTKEALRIGAEAIILAGDVQQRQLVREHMRKGLQDKVVETEASHRARNASEEGLQREVAETIQSAVWSRVAETVQEFKRERGQGAGVVEGWRRTVGALQRDQVRTLMWADPDTDGSLRIGPSASHIALDDEALTAMGIREAESVPPGEAIVRSLVGTQAELVLVDPEKVEMAEGIGAVLRYSDASTTP